MKRNRVTGTWEEYQIIPRGKGKTVHNIYEEEHGNWTSRRQALTAQVLAAPFALGTNVAQLSWFPPEMSVPLYNTQTQGVLEGDRVKHKRTRVRLCVTWPQWLESWTLEDNYEPEIDEGRVESVGDRAAYFFMLMLGPGQSPGDAIGPIDIPMVMKDDAQADALNWTVPVVDTMDGRYEVIGFDKATPEPHKMLYFRDSASSLLPIGRTITRVNSSWDKQVIDIELDRELELVFGSNSFPQKYGLYLWHGLSLEHAVIRPQNKPSIEAHVKYWWENIMD